MTNTTNTNTINSITNVIYNELERALTEDLRGDYRASDFDLVDAALRSLGLDIRLPYDLSRVDEWRDRITYRDEDGYVNTTHIGDLLLTAVSSYDYSDREDTRLPGRPLKEGETVYSYGCARTEYVGILTAPCVSEDLAEQYHLTAWRLLPVARKAVEDAEARKRKSWGWETNLRLSVAGCSQAEIQAWWSMSWKREVSPEVWADLCHNTPVLSIEYALEATSSRYLERIDMFLGGSFPRSMDIINALAKAKGITQGRKLPHKKADFGVPAPKYIATDGSRVWSF